jgi:hypothetical protein
VIWLNEGLLRHDHETLAPTVVYTVVVSYVPSMCLLETEVLYVIISNLIHSTSNNAYTYYTHVTSSEL